MANRTTLNVRRVVPGHDGGGKAVIVDDKVMDNVIVMKDDWIMQLDDGAEAPARHCHEANGTP